MTEASTHDKQVKNLMTAEIWMQLVKNRQFQGVNHTTDRIDDSSGKQPCELRGSQCLKKLGDRKDADPSHRDI